MIDCNQGVITNDRWKKVVRTYIQDCGTISSAIAAERALKEYDVKEHSLEEARVLNLQVLEEIEADKQVSGQRGPKGSA